MLWGRGERDEETKSAGRNSRGCTVTKVVGKRLSGQVTFKGSSTQRQTPSQADIYGKLSQAGGTAEAGAYLACSRTVLPLRNRIQAT